MNKPTLPQRVLERMDKLEDRLERIATALEQQNALMARGSFQVVGTTGSAATGQGGQAARSVAVPDASAVKVARTYYGTPNAETQRDQTKRGGKVRRPRQASRG